MFRKIKLSIVFFFISFFLNEFRAQVSVVKTPTFHNADISVLLSSGYDNDNTAKVSIEYGEKLSELSLYFPPTRLTVLGLNEFKGSLFF